ncbi:carboxymuconolactone decarboxylase family protein [Bacillus pretiosus]|uniref:carboxymuconolactone decarboxylase family protein n=1 Tax=Bacillus pretiosus TaxID=2983392 RepID=UPI003D66095A
MSLEDRGNRPPLGSNNPGSRRDDSSYQSADGVVTDRRYERGLEVYASQFQIPREEVASWFAERFGERFGEEAILSAAGAWVDDDLSLRDRSLIVIAALITQGGAEQQLRFHTRWAIQHGCTRKQLEALATLLGVYAGYPRASSGMMIVHEELAKLEER